MFSSKNLSRYVLLEKSPTNTKVIGIYTYAEAIKKKEELTSKLAFQSISVYGYEIQGPFNVNLNDNPDIEPVINPFILEPPMPTIPEHPTPMIESPRLFKKSKFVFKEPKSDDMKIDEFDDYFK